ncbi:MAG TPA: SapC family protein, partial [Cellvibrio sp.]
SQPSLMVYVDMDSPRLSETEGDAVFLPHGGYSPYLESVIQTLDYVQYGNELNENFMAALLELELLEVVVLEVTLKNGEQNNITGLYTINEEKLSALSAEHLGLLMSKGYLEFIYMALASQSNVAKLIARIEKKIQQQ